MGAASSKGQAGQADVKPGVLVPAAAIVERDGARCRLRDQWRCRAAAPSSLAAPLGDDHREVLQGLSGGDAVVLDRPNNWSTVPRAPGARKRLPTRTTTDPVTQRIPTEPPCPPFVSIRNLQ